RQFAELGRDADLLRLLGGHFEHDRTATLRVRRVDGQHAEVLRDRLADRAARQPFRIEVLRQDDIDAVARIEETRAGPDRGDRDCDRARPRGQHDLQELTVAGLDNKRAPDRLAAREIDVERGARDLVARLLVALGMDGRERPYRVPGSTTPAAGRHTTSSERISVPAASGPAAAIATP